jgi:hypothetical protein
MKIYTTMVLNFLDKYSLVETFTSQEIAMARALCLGKEYDASNVDDNPSISSYNEAVQWFVLNTQNHLVVVLETELMFSLPHFRGDHKHSAAPVAEVPSCAPTYNTYDDDLPGGWNHSGEPITMKQIRLDPFNAKFSDELTQAQRWALVKARITKSPNFSCCLFLQTSALLLLGKSWKDASPDALTVIAQECEYINRFIDDERSLSDADYDLI